jgi:CheY-like chemotaxis protein
MTRTFAPVAKQRGLKFTTHCTADCPETIQTDRQRIEQVLKNLLSNALKFTEEGEVELTVSRADDGRVALAVRDTGIGVSEDKQKLIFEAFRQADGTTNRKYGGTGLGLSISRQLATLLGGEVRLTSKPGHGSTFTLLLPEVHTANTSAQPSVTSSSMQAGESASVATSYEPLASSRRSVTDRIATRQVDDDRDSLTSVTRIILVVEDDEPFARILRDLAHEMDFQCLVATTAEAAFELAVEHTPSAVILDVGLPDHSGLWVLDRLKHDRRTRHIPVHVVSASDNAKPALSLGAVGHLLKPVDRARLVEAFQDLESRLEQRVGRVLLVEDDPVQLESLRKLLGSQDVETIGASTAAECLARLKSETFDCMVLDLSLPDASGHALLETLSREDAYSFPPVIVYTGRDLSPDEEQRLRRYSQSIIIKGAKSPERLLDEITLFLHKVVSDLPAEQARMLEKARSRDSEIEGRRILVVEDDVRNVFALTSVLEPRGAIVQIARNGREALDKLAEAQNSGEPVDLVLMDVMMPEMDGITAVRELRKRAEWKKMPVIMLTAKAMKDDQEQCLAAGASDYMAKPLDVEKLLSLIRVWIPR